MTRRIYKTPPIEEALVEFHFRSDVQWDPLLPYAFREHIKGVYPSIPCHKTKIEAAIHPGPDNEGAVIAVRGDHGRIQFSTEDGSRLVSVSPSMLTVHALRPYPGWESFRQQIEEALHLFAGVAKVAGIVRIGLRYINKLQIKTDESVSLDDYFVSPPNTPNGFPMQVTKFFSRMEHVYDDVPVRLIRTFADADAPEGMVGFLLDLDLIWEWREVVLPIGEAMGVVDQLRERERDAFEMLITDRTREVFDGT